MVWSRVLLLYLWEKHAQWSDCVETGRVLDPWHKGLYFQGIFEYQCWDMITPLAQPDHTPSPTSPPPRLKRNKGKSKIKHTSVICQKHIHLVLACKCLYSKNLHIDMIWYSSQMHFTETTYSPHKYVYFINQIRSGWTEILFLERDVSASCFLNGVFLKQNLIHLHFI